MKKLLLFRAIALLAFLTCALGASADRVNFSKDGMYFQLTTYTDGSGVITIENSGSFNTYSGVVNIPDTVYYEGKYYPVTGIGYQAFKNCSGLTAVTIPEGVTMLLNESFAGCTSLTSITLPSTLTSIYNNAFTGCTNLTSITSMNGNPRTFNSNNFDASTYANATLKVPQGSKSLYQSTSAWSQFSNIQEINKFVVDGIYYTVTSGSNVSVTYRDGNYSSYYGEIIVPATVTYNGVTYTVTGVGESAFRGCSCNGRNLYITLPNTVTTIGAYAFYGSNLVTIEMGTGLTSIGDFAFAGTESTLYILISHAMMPPSTGSNTFSQEILDNVFLWIPRMAYGRYTTSRYWGNFNQENLFYAYDFVVDGVYYGINSNSQTVEVSAYALATDTTSLFSGFSQIENVTIPPTVTYEGVEYIVNRVGSYAFYQWEVKELSLPFTIESIEPYAVTHCETLETVNLSEGVTRIGVQAFRACQSLQSVEIPNSVKSIDYAAFYGCSSLETLVLGACLEQIGEYAFRTSTNLTSVTSYALIPPVITDYVFAGVTYNEAELIVPMSSLQDYRTAVGWQNFYSFSGMHTLDEALNVKGGNIHFDDEGDYPWELWNDGNRLYAQSGNGGVHNSESRLTTTVRVDEPSILSFDFKAWGESDPEYTNLDYDECVFMANGTSVFRYGARDNDWETFSYELKPNVTYRLVWFYHKDVSDHGVGDYFALDNVQIRPKATRGDVDGDGHVDINDVTALISVVLGNAVEYNATAADCDVDGGSGTVDINDVTALISFVLSGHW